MTLNIALIGASGKLGKRIAALAQKSNFPICQHVTRDSPFDPAIPTEVIIDVSSIDGYKTYLDDAIQLSIPVIIGVTGLPTEALQMLKKASSKIPVLIAPNFSLGSANLKKLALQLPKGNVHIHEVHHAEKKDAPSGTAKALAEKFEDPKVTYDRVPNVVGTHSIKVSLPFETIEIRHEVTDRDVFARGALKAASFLYHKPPALYTDFHDEDS